MTPTPAPNGIITFAGDYIVLFDNSGNTINHF